MGIVVHWKLLGVPISCYTVFMVSVVSFALFPLIVVFAVIMSIMLIA